MSRRKFEISIQLLAFVIIASGFRSSASRSYLSSFIAARNSLVRPDPNAEATKHYLGPIGASPVSSSSEIDLSLLRNVSNSITASFLKQNMLNLIVTGILAVLGTVSASTVPLFFSKVLQALTATEFSMANLLRPLSCMLVLHIMEPLLTVLFVRRCSVLIDKFTSLLRVTTYSNALARDVTTFERSGSASDAAQLVTSEVDKIKTTSLQNISRDRGVRAGLELLLGLSILFVLCRPLAIMYSVLIPFTSFLASRFARGMFRAAAKEGEAAKKQANRALETLTNFKEVFSFSNQPLEERRFQESQAEASEATRALGRAKASFEAANRAGIYTNILTMFFFGGILISKGLIKPSVLISFMSYNWSLNFAMQGLLYSYGDFQTVSASWQRVVSFISEYQPFLKAESLPLLQTQSQYQQQGQEHHQQRQHEYQHEQSHQHQQQRSIDPADVTAAPATTSPPHPTIVVADDENAACHYASSEAAHQQALAKWISISSSKPMEVQLKNVSFSYPNRPDVPVLNNVNLHIPAGKVTALVGPSGAGKSTLAALLNRFYEPTSGALLVDDIDRSSLSRDEYLARVSVVRQTPALFTDTVANNIAYGAVAYRPVTQEDIVAAAKAANAHNFISALPEGYLTIVGEGPGKVQLSGGQKQRIAIARALLKNANLLVLDEATSALDSESEALVQDALTHLMEGRTTVVIAHRLSTVIDADQIVVVRDGTIAEVGTHEQLMTRKGGQYYSLMSTQMSGYQQVVVQGGDDGDLESRPPPAALE